MRLFFVTQKQINELNNLIYSCAPQTIFIEEALYGHAHNKRICQTKPGWKISWWESIMPIWNIGEMQISLI